MTELRHTTFTGKAKDDAVLSAENARDANDAFAERVKAYMVAVTYTATGATSSWLPVRCKSRPAGVLLLNAYLTLAPSSDLGAVGRCNFAWDAATSSARVYEPDGLTAGAVCVLTFLVVES